MSVRSQDSHLLQCFQALVHCQSISQYSGSRMSNCIPFKTVKESKCTYSRLRWSSDWDGLREARIVTYFSVFKLWFTLRVSASAEAPETPIAFPSRLWKRVQCTPELVQVVNGVSVQLTSVLPVTYYVAVLWPEIWLQCQSDQWFWRYSGLWWDMNIDSQ